MLGRVGKLLEIDTKVHVGWNFHSIALRIFAFTLSGKLANATFQIIDAGEQQSLIKRLIKLKI